jgi:hypothetical protein
MMRRFFSVATAIVAIFVWVLQPTAAMADQLQSSRQTEQSSKQPYQQTEQTYSNQKPQAQVLYQAQDVPKSYSNNQTNQFPEQNSKRGSKSQQQQVPQQK